MTSRLLNLALAIALFFILSTSHAQNWPQRPIKVLVPSTAGSSPDVLARLLGQRMEGVLGQTLVIDNKPGAGGILATDTLTKATPDGYTLLLAHDGNMAINTVLYKALPYDPQKDFTAVAKLALNEFVLIAAPSTGVRSFADFVSFVKSPGNKATYASAGIGSPNHVFMEELLRKFGGSMLHVPFNGGADAVTGVLGGQTQFMLAGIAPAIGHIRSGKLNAVAVVQTKRAAILPDVPTVGESIPGFGLETWFGLFAPADTPRTIVAKLASTLQDVLSRAEVRDKLTQLGMATDYQPGDLLARQISSDIARYRLLAKEIKLEAN